MKRNSLYFALCALVALVMSTWAAELPRMAQSIRLVKGWNAIYIKGTPNETPDQLFASWPVDTVGLYDAAAFTATRQFAAGLDTEGVATTGMRVWRRSDPDASTLNTLHGNAVYLCRATAAYTTTIYGVPEAMRLSWHPASGTNAVLNYVGISLASTNTSNKASLAKYFSGLDAGSTFMKSIYGTAADGPQPSPVAVTQAGDGAVIVMDATTSSDWSGVLYVTPARGVDFETNLLTSVVKVRNDGATARTVKLSLRMGDAPVLTDRMPVPQILWRDRSSATGWNAANVLPNAEPSRQLAPGESWTIEFALDRSQFNGIAKGVQYGGLLTFTDVDGGSGFATTIPVSATSDGGEAMLTAWPAGLWLCEVNLNKVYSISSEDDAGSFVDSVSGGKAGGTMRARLPIHVDTAGNIRLMQHVSIVAMTNADGQAEYALYAPTAMRPTDSVERMRISSVVLPTDLGVIAPTNGAVFGAEAIFDFTVGETSKVNPFRHALHPNHDGLRSDFMTPTPSGDETSNYLSTVKPELFSIVNQISLVWDANTGSVWSPEEKLQGACSWTLRNLRRDCDLQLKGEFTMQRISTNPVLNQ